MPTVNHRQKILNRQETTPLTEGRGLGCNIDLTGCVKSVKSYFSPPLNRQSTKQREKEAEMTPLSKLSTMHSKEEEKEGGPTEPDGAEGRLRPRVIIKADTGRTMLPSEGTFRQRVFALFDDPESCVAATIVNIVVLCFIMLSCVSFVVETLPQYRYPIHERVLAPDGTMAEFYILELVSIVVFTIEYFMRFFSVPGVSYEQLGLKDDGAPKIPCLLGGGLCPRGAQKLWGFFWKPMNFIDFAAIIPFYIGIIATAADPDGGNAMGGLGFLRVLRLARIFRVFKLGKYNQGSQLFLEVIRQSMSAMMILLFYLVMSMVLFGSIIYFLESGEWHPDCSSFVTVDAGLCKAATGDDHFSCLHNNRAACEADIDDGYGGGCMWVGVGPHPRQSWPEEKTRKGCYARPDQDGTGYEISPFYSIPQAFWWVVVTITTVGYGDIYPTSALGQMVGMICAIVGPCFVLALPITVIGTNFHRIFFHKITEARRGKVVKMHPIASATRDLQGILDALNGMTEAITTIIRTNEQYLEHRAAKLGLGATLGLAASASASQSPGPPADSIRNKETLVESSILNKLKGRTSDPPMSSSNVALDKRESIFTKMQKIRETVELTGHASASSQVKLQDLTVPDMNVKSADRTASVSASPELGVSGRKRSL